ncbi:MAG: 2,3-bisphosphoglycerate-independent phosphoglycerate mutase [Desulfovibrionaceae bacterium]|nr:2,3-bisphosphoglycerate-independent phosphoglycerate mutase [Desulfovibrionaceae bacterium]
MTPTLLLILDGWGIAPAGPGNAPFVARTPHMDALLASCAHTRLAASGRDVGLPAGYIGNSEVGHLNIGAGRVVYQDMTRIDVAMENGELDKNPVFLELVDKVRAAGGRLHLAGLLSDGGVHSHISHLKALTRIACERGVSVLVHCFMDGRDTNPHRGVEYLSELQTALQPLKTARIADLCGRFYAMDRDRRWERVQQAWNLLVHGQGEAADDPVAAARASYAADITDEFIKPTRIGPADGADGSALRDGDGLFLFNFRADRMRQLVQALTLPDFDGFERGGVPRLAGLATMTAYDASFDVPVAFPKDAVLMGLGEVVSGLGLKQLRLAETEKYAHVTYFFNGGREEPFPGEDRMLVPSPRDVATYDLKPGMSARQVTDKFLEAWKSGVYSLVVCNLANGDMVGHTGVLKAAVAACEVVDECVGRMVEAVRASGGRMVIIADHGNCEVMLDAQGQPQTAHTTNPVPCILVEEGAAHALPSPGRLADVAPTILGLWNVEPPVAMTGKNLAELC